MRIVQAPRASAILYHLLTSHTAEKPWLLPANICPVVPLTFFKAGVPFEFVDISAVTLHMDLDQVEDRIRRRRYAGILYAHTYGDPTTPADAFQSFRNLDAQLLIVDDRCLCVPEFAAKSPAQITLFSTGYSKIVDLGHGGYAILDDRVEYQPEALPFQRDKDDEIVRSYKEAIAEGRRFDYRDSAWLDTDSSLPTWETYESRIAACLEETLAHRASMNHVYESRLPADMQLPGAYQLWRFNIRLKDRQPVLKAIFDAGLFASSHYAPLTGIMGDGAAPHATALAGSVINLFNDHHFDAGMAAHICDVILENHES